MVQVARGAQVDLACRVRPVDLSFISKLDFSLQVISRKLLLKLFSVYCFYRPEEMQADRTWIVVACRPDPDVSTGRFGHLMFLSAIRFHRKGDCAYES